MKLILRQLFTIALLLSALVTAYSQTASVVEGCAPLVVQFTGPDGQDSYFWDFKNGNNSSLQNPAETFLEAGVYEVELSESNGSTVLGTVTITVYAKPELSFAADPAGGCAPLPVQFNNNSQVDQAILDGGISWNWNFGDGTTEQVEAPSHTFGTSGSYNITLQLVSGLNNCSVVETEANFVNVSSVDANFITDPTPAVSCEAPLTVNFVNQTVGDNLTFDWDFGNGLASPDVNPGAVDYTSEGEYEVLLTVTDQNGCVGTETRVVSVGTPTADFNVPDTVCLGQAVMIENLSSAGTYSWDFGPDADPGSSSEFSPEVTFNAAGEVDITLTVTSLDGGDCENEVIKTIFVQEVDGSFTTDPAFLCSEPFEFTYTPATIDAEGTYSWVFSDSTTSSETMPTYTVPVDTNVYAETGVRAIETQLNFTSSAGCTTTFTRTDTVFQAYALFMPDIDNGCAPLEVTFSDSSKAYRNIVSYTYIYGDGQTATFNNDDDHSYTFTEAGEYDVLLVIEDANGCTDTSYAVRIDVGEPITADFASDKQEVCPGEEVTLTTTTQDERIDAWHFDTDDGRSSHCYKESSMTWSFISEAKPTDVTLTVEYNGCYSELTKEDFITVKGPIANLYYEMECEAPLEYTFRDSSYDATTVSWDFGDGNTGTGAEVVHTFAQPGDYWVKLTAENPGTGCAASVDSALVCVRLAEAKFELEPMICIGQQVDLDGSESVGVNAECWKGYTWYFDISGRPITTQDSSIEFSFSNPGMETVMLEVEDVNGCKDTATVMTQIYDIQASFELDDSRICIPGTVNFTDLSEADTMITKWEWMFGDGVGMSSQQNPSYTYNSLAGVPPGEGISVTLSIEDRLGCTAESSQTISVYRPTSSIGANDLTICAGETVTFTASDFTAEGSNLTFNWDFGNGQTSDDQNDSATYAEGGSYPVTLNYTEIATGCVGQTIATVQVQDFPSTVFNYTADGETNPENICRQENVIFSHINENNQAYSYVWTAGGQSSTGASPTFNFSETGEVTYNVTVTSTFGCASEGSGNFNIVGPEGDFTVSDFTICLGDAVTFNVVDTAGVNTWQWTFGDGATATDESPITHTYNDENSIGVRTVVLTLTGDNQCVAEASQQIEIGGGILDLPDVSACAGDPVTLDSGELFPTSTYSWTPAQFLDDASAQNPVATVNENTTFMLTITSDEGCVTQGSVTVNVVPLVNFAGQNIVVCDNAPVTLPQPENPNGTYTFEWSPEGPIVSLGPNEETKTVNLRIRDAAGCNDDNLFEFNIAQAANSFKVPNAFTPNGDEVNNEFRIYSEEGTNLNVTIFKVYNRWGKVVFDGNGANNPTWNGDFNGEPAPSDVYTYFIEIEIPQCEEPIQKRGDVTLLR